MADINEGIAIGIGAQTDQATANTDVVNADDLSTAIAGTVADVATGILLRSPEDLSKAFERIESDGGVTPGSLTRESGGLIRVAPTVSFIIDAMGNRIPTGAPDIGDFDLAEYFKRILAGARLEAETGTATETEYRFAATSAAAFHTLKIWRGTVAQSESWALVGCTFNLSFAYSAGDKTTITVDVIADSVIYDGATSVFPPAAPSVAYGNQTGAAPILESAPVVLNGVATRGFQTGTLTIAYPENEIQDTRASGGIRKSQGTPRGVDFEAVFFGDDADSDFDFLTQEFDGATQGPEMSFTLGQAATAGNPANALKFEIPSWRVESTDKADGDQVLRTISGYAARRGTSGFGFDINEEFRLSSV